MKKAILLAVGLIVVASPALAVNILGNPGFETGALPPWYQKADFGGPENWNATTADKHSGEWSATDVGNKLIAQDFAAVPVADILLASFWLRNVDASINAVYFEYSDTTTEENIWFPTGGWDYIDATGWLDAGKSLVSFGVYGVIGGNTQRTYVDDWTLDVIPEPTTLVLLAAAALFRRR